MRSGGLAHLLCSWLGLKKEKKVVEEVRIEAG